MNPLFFAPLQNLAGLDENEYTAFVLSHISMIIGDIPNVTLWAHKMYQHTPQGIFYEKILQTINIPLYWK